MKILIKKAKIIDHSSTFNNQIMDIMIDNGIITEIKSYIKNATGTKIIEFENMHVSPGWFDSSVSFGEPGFEHRENIENGLLVAAKSGFTAVCVQPNTNPVVDNQSIIHFMKVKSAGFATDLFPIGAFTKGSKGFDLAELFDMKKAGAVAFGDYCASVHNANLLKIGLQYVQDFDGLLVPFCRNSDLSAMGVVNESEETMHLGLAGIPNLAEEIDVARNLFLLEYTGGKMHIPTISTAGSAKLICDAKARGLNVTCSVAVHHLTLTDGKLANFDTNFKTMPPLRSDIDRKALIDAVLDGTIDIITSDHNPIDVEEKFLEFDKAAFGTIGLESAFAALTVVLPIDVIVEKFIKARIIFGFEQTTIAVNVAANITMFSPTNKYEFSHQHIFSKSSNSAFLNTNVAGIVHGIVNNNQLVLNNLQ